MHIPVSTCHTLIASFRSPSKSVFLVWKAWGWLALQLRPPPALKWEIVSAVGRPGTPVPRTRHITERQAHLSESTHVISTSRQATRLAVNVRRSFEPVVFWQVLHSAGTSTESTHDDVPQSWNPSITTLGMYRGEALDHIRSYYIATEGYKSASFLSNAI
ncbi:uncharacterized protein M421DRAFT_359903 [Didymella exigua CBS 183.55]|uniref:Uncharacterized protein n=1 Tax=Didymella exigua CBS 183.55 TaxID=1150837 RepID=A0A6A5RV13_9PLEO|nr:uncharacterized protein M421DRAFT_359903 [Didymella exigua CBS 183.55]KAF1930808.1 hypothetical protein M421DRAFT_359903 [Didymella exigua CBS 183.55]